MKRNQRIALMVVIGLLITVIIGINARQTIHRLVEMNNWVVHTYKVLSKAQRIESLLTNMDNDLRGYLLSNNSYFRSDFERTSREMSVELKGAQELMCDNPDQTKRVQLLIRLYREKVSRSQSLLKAGLVQPGMPRLDSLDLYLALSSDFYQVVKATVSDENRLLETRMVESKRSASYALISNLVGATAALVMILWAIYVLYRSLRKSTLLNQRLRHSEQQTKKLLEAVPVPIVIVNHQGKFYYANQAASHLIENINEYDPYDDEVNSNRFFRFPEGVPYPREQRPTYRALQGEATQVDDLELRMNGKRFQLLSSSSPVYDASGNLQYVITSSIDISDRVQSQQRLQEARIMAEKAAKLKEDFLANMSHEIRTPLNAMLGFSELMETTNLDADQQEFLRLIRTAGKNLLTIVNDILDISKIEAGMIQLESIPFSIQMLTASIKAMCQGAATDKGLQLIVEIDPNLPTVFMGDPTRLTQILLNLINNAIKFTKQGSVTLLIEQGERTTSASVPVRFIVQDTGIGMATEVLPTIFERFQQADKFTTRYYGGTGLGLNIVKSLTELQKGFVGVESTLGQGSRFTIEIPYVLAKEQINFNQPHILTPSSNQRAVRVLVVEDNLMNQKLVLQVLKHLGYQGRVADDGRKAIEILQNNTFDIILMDLQMPVMDGYETTRYIRSKINATVPIIAMTAHALPSEKEECLKAGMNDFLSKPFQIEELQLLIRPFLPTETSVLKTPEPTVVAAPVSGHFSPEPILKMLGNNVEAVIEILGTYLNDTPEDIEKLQQALDQQDVKEVKRLIHIQKVHTKMLGMDEATRLILETEALIIAGNGIEAITPLMESYVLEVKATLPHIGNFVRAKKNEIA
ncbi:response regulator [Spirosoma sp.]|uniref:response regulator n=1 Tax=Spirosoma sp. TaxID=1899569 RepID=UPI00262C2F2E|nr:response regulator [Spirosoma sp.]MCX6218839.1 response regulator [Spirosoma sp.]